MFFTISVWEGCYCQPSSLARVCFSRFLSGKGVVFRPNSLARDVFWSWFDTEILSRVVTLPFFLGRVENVCLGRVRVHHPGLHSPIRNLVKSPPPPPSPSGTLVLCSCSLLQHPRHCKVYPPVLKFLYNTGTLLPLALDNTEWKNTSLNSPVYFLGHHHLPPDYHYWCYLGLCCCSGHCLNESLLAQSHNHWVLHHLATKLSLSVDRKESSRCLEESPKW